MLLLSRNFKIIKSQQLDLKPIKWEGIYACHCNPDQLLMVGEVMDPRREPTIAIS